MISVGIDVSKGKSTVCFLAPYGKLLKKPFEVMHDKNGLSTLVTMLKELEGEIRLVMEATGVYHLPILLYLKEEGFFVSVINPYEMKAYCTCGLRRVKTDKQDAIKIANFGINNWYKLKDYQVIDDIYS